MAVFELDIVQSTTSTYALEDRFHPQHYTPTVLAVALRVHLETLLQALLEGNVCTREEVRDFVKELERDALQYEED